MNEVICEVTKLAWIREPDYPVGRPAPGRFTCPCGNQSEPRALSESAGDWKCKCGKVWAWDGWMVLADNPIVPAPVNTPKGPARRDWMSIGREYTNNRQPEVQHQIERLEWLALVPGKSERLPFSQGEGLKHVIQEMKLPNVDAIAWNGYFEFADGPGYPSAPDSKGYGVILGIQAHYKNADVRMYLLDHGDAITPLCVDVWEKQP